MNQLQALMDSLNAWHSHTLASTTLEAGQLIRMVQVAGMELSYRQRPKAPRGQIEAFELPDLHCTRCGRHLKHPQYLNGAPFGSTCVFREGIGE